MTDHRQNQKGGSVEIDWIFSQSASQLQCLSSAADVVYQAGGGHFLPSCTGMDMVENIEMGKLNSLVDACLEIMDTTILDLSQMVCWTMVIDGRKVQTRILIMNH